MKSDDISLLDRLLGLATAGWIYIRKGGNFIEICGDLTHDEGVRDAVEAVFSDLVLARVVGVEWVCADVFWQ